ncbi:MAG: hypothetical protein GY778_11150, partial [bacterium]|nr:hypothetical protein [bacterium]
MRPYWTLACVGIVLGCAAVAGADEVAAPWGTIHGNNSGTASSDHATMVFDASTWSFGATEAWSVDLDAAGIRRTAFWSSITFDEDGNLYWKGHESTSGAADSQVVSVAPDGTARWTGNDGAGGDHFVGSTSTDSVVVGDGGSSGRVYALGDAGTTDSGFVVAYSKLDGSAQWLTTLPGSKFSGTDVGARRLTPVLYNGKLYVVGAFQFPGPVVKVYQIDSTTGILDWSADLTAGFSGITVNYRGQMTLVPDAFGAGKHGLYFNGSSGNGNDTKNEMNALELDTTANSASIKWSAEGGHVTRSHVMHLALGAAGPTDDRVCTHTWTDFGAELYCWDLDGLNPVADNNQPDSGHGFYDVGCVDFDGDDIIAGGFDGRIIRYQDVLNVGTDGVDPTADVYYQMA